MRSGFWRLSSNSGEVQLWQRLLELASGVDRNVALLNDCNRGLSRRNLPVFDVLAICEDHGASAECLDDVLVTHLPHELWVGLQSEHVSRVLRLRVPNPESVFAVDNGTDAEERLSDVVDWAWKCAWDERLLVDLLIVKAPYVQVAIVV